MFKSMLLSILLCRGESWACQKKHNKSRCNVNPTSFLLSISTLIGYLMSPKQAQTSLIYLTTDFSLSMDCNILAIENSIEKVIEKVWLAIII